MKLNNQVYIVAEAGQNHNGDMKLAKSLIDMAAMPIFDSAFDRELTKVNAIKFTKRDLSEELTSEAWYKPYDSPNSFGATYGEHRQRLELTYGQHIELFHYAKEKGLDFIETLTSPKTLKLIEKINIDFIKVASRDITNIPLLHMIGETKIPVIISTGMSGETEIDEALNILTKYHDDVVILHCISQYPADYYNLNLRSIPYLVDKYPFQIGYSDHSIGIVAPVVAASIGARFIEKHITLSHSLKGSDHKGALQPDGLWRMVRDIRNMEVAMGKKQKIVNKAVKPFKEKLERSICTNRNLNKGDKLEEKDLIMLSPGGGLKWQDRNNILGRRVKSDINEYTMLKREYFE